jgi:hypothetical protein
MPVHPRGGMFLSLPTRLIDEFIATALTLRAGGLILYVRARAC